MEFLETIIPILNDCNWISIGFSDQDTLTFATGSEPPFSLKCERGASLLRMVCVQLTVIADHHGLSVSPYGGSYEVQKPDEANRWPKYRAEFVNSPGRQKLCLSKLA